MTKKQILTTGAVTALFIVSLIANAATVFAQTVPIPTVTLNDIAPQTATFGDIVSFTASATDSDPAGVVTYGLNLKSIDAGIATIDPTTGVFIWDTAASRSAYGIYTWFVTATGCTGGYDNKAVLVTVNT